MATHYTAPRRRFAPLECLMSNYDPYSPRESTGRSAAGRCMLSWLASWLRGDAPCVCFFSCACRLQADGSEANVFFGFLWLTVFATPRIMDANHRNRCVTGLRYGMVVIMIEKMHNQEMICLDEERNCGDSN